MASVSDASHAQTTSALNLANKAVGRSELHGPVGEFVGLGNVTRIDVPDSLNFAAIGKNLVTVALLIIREFSVVVWNVNS
jgi:hypothetical protein